MKAFSFIKTLTVVVLVLCTRVGWGEEKFITMKSGKKIYVGDPGCSFYEKGSDDRKECDGKMNDLNENSSNLADRKEERLACKEAYTAYRDVASKEKEACAAFEKTKEKSTCSERVERCAKKIDDLSQPYGTNLEGDTGLEAVENIAYQSLRQSLGINNNQNGQNFLGNSEVACVKSIDRKTVASDKKEKDRLRRELNDKIKTQKDEIIKAKEDLDKERNSVNEKIAEIEAENKKESLNKDKKMREELSKISKNTIESAKRLRNYALAVTKEMQGLANINFEFQSSLLELTDEKIDQRCKQEFESLKAGIVNSKLGSAPAGASAEEKKQYESLAALAAQYKSKGIKGTGELKTMLLTTRKACYERASVSRNKAKMANAQNVKNAQDKIDELKNSMNDEKKNQELDQTNMKNIQAETDKEKSQEETEKLEKLNNLSTKVSNLASSADLKTKAANEKIQELTAEIQNLSLVQKFDVESAYADAEEAIDKGRLARSKALEDCNCSDATAAKTTTCKQLVSDESKNPREKEKKSTAKDRTKT